MNILIYFFVGAATGILSGLLGLGGGIIMVPALLAIFSRSHLPLEHTMHLATGTSLAVIFFTSATSLYSHKIHLQDAFKIYKRLLGGLVFGALAGAYFVSVLKTQMLILLFGILLVFISLNLFFGKAETLQTEKPLPGILSMFGFGVGIGALASVFGIGGAIVTIPLLTYYAVPLRQAIVVSMLVGFTVSFLGTLIYMGMGYSVSGLPLHSLGYVYVPAWLGLLLGSLLFVPVGAWISARLSTEKLKKIFALFLLIIGIKMILEF